MGDQKPINTKAGQHKDRAPPSKKPAGDATSGRFSAKLALQRAFVAAPTD